MYETICVGAVLVSGSGIVDESSILKVDIAGML